MRFQEVCRKEVMDPEGRLIGSVEDIILKEDGTYSLIVKGELDEVQRVREIEKFGNISASDRFEVPISALNGIEEKIVLKKKVNELLENNEITIISQQ